MRWKPPTGEVVEVSLSMVFLVCFFGGAALWVAHMFDERAEALEYCAKQGMHITNNTGEWMCIEPPPNIHLIP